MFWKLRIYSGKWIQLPSSKFKFYRCSNRPYCHTLSSWQVASYKTTGYITRWHTWKCGRLLKPNTLVTQQQINDEPNSLIALPIHPTQHYGCPTTNDKLKLYFRVRLNHLCISGNFWNSFICPFDILRLDSTLDLVIWPDGPTSNRLSLETYLVMLCV